MPNHCTNNVRISCENGVEIAEKIKGADQAIDFEKILPPPENMFRGDLSREKQLELDASGIPHWLGWQSNHWGTKWNAYSTELIEADEYGVLLKFDTAWSPPTPIFEALADLPGVESVYGNYVIEFAEDAGVFHYP